MHHPLMPEYVMAVVRQLWIEDFDWAYYSSCSVSLCSNWPDYLYREYKVYPFNYDPIRNYDERQPPPVSYVLSLTRNRNYSYSDAVYDELSLDQVIERIGSALLERDVNVEKALQQPGRQNVIAFEEIGTNKNCILVTLKRLSDLRWFEILRTKIRQARENGFVRFIVEYQGPLHQGASSDHRFLLSLSSVMSQKYFE